MVSTIYPALVGCWALWYRIVWKNGTHQMNPATTPLQATLIENSQLQINDYSSQAKGRP
jgi:hypothetical protein